MFKNISNKKLVAVFAALLLIVVVVYFFDASKGDRTFKSEIFELDTAKVTTISIVPRGSSLENSTILTKESKGWMVASEGKKYSADEQMVNNMLAELKKLKSKRVAATDKDKWEEFEVTDSTATRVTVEAGKKDRAVIYIGKFTYQQPKNQNPYSYGRQQQGIMSTCIRLSNDKNVYVVDGFLNMTFGRSITDLRNKTLVRSNKNNWKNLSFVNKDAVNGAFSLSKQGDNWMVDGLMADSASVANYFSKIENLISYNFVDGIVPVQGSEVLKVKIDGDNFVAPIEIKAYPSNDTTNLYLIESSANPGVYFSGAQSGLAEKIFIDKQELLPKANEDEGAIEQ